MRPKGAKTGRYTANVNASMDSGMHDNPLEYSDYGDDNKGSKHNTEMLSAVFHEVLKVMNQKQQKDGSGSKKKNNGCNFAGTISVLNACSYDDMNDKKFWIIDSGASDHIASGRKLFSELRDLSKAVNISMPYGRIKLVKQIGTIILSP